MDGELWSPISEICDLLKNLSRMFSSMGVFKSIIVFGSAARPGDFIPKVSDIDVLIVTDLKPIIKYDELIFKDYRISLVFTSRDELEEMFEIGDPLSFMLRYSIAVVDDGTYQSITKLKPRITEHTRRILRRSIFVALSLAIEKYFHKIYVESISHLHHSIRHLVRYTACLNGDSNKFPISNNEVYNYSREPTRSLFKILTDTRRRKVDEEEVYILIDKVIESISYELNLKPTFLKDLKTIIKGSIEEVIVYEVNNQIVFRILVFDNNLRKLEIRGNNIKEINRMIDTECRLSIDTS